MAESLSQSNETADEREMNADKVKAVSALIRLPSAASCKRETMNFAAQRLRRLLPPVSVSITLAMAAAPRPTTSATLTAAPF
jgi:peptidoglycan/LPS O-acetylase OafA/YrhL